MTMLINVEQRKGVGLGTKRTSSLKSNLKRAPNVVKRIYQTSRVLGGGLSVLRFIFDEIRQRTTRISGAWGRSADRMKEHSQLTKRHAKNIEERTKLERTSAIDLHVLETEHHVDFDNPWYSV